MKKVIVSVSNDLSTDQRVHKVCTTLHRMGFAVTLVGRKLPDSKPLEDREYATHRMRLLFKKGPLFYAFFNLRLFAYLLFRKADVLLANDLDTLFANHWAKKFKKATLVYDSHEYYTEVPELVARPKVQRFWERIEGICFPKLKRIYTVNQSIADLYEKKYNKPLKVVRNIPRFEPLENPKSRADLNLPVDRKIMILQGAWINVDRGGEEAVQAMQFVENALLLIIGGGDVVDELKRMVVALKLEEKVCILGRMPYVELRHYTANADIGLTLDKDTNINYRFSLPNKIFDYIHAGCAVLASDLVEVKRVVLDNNVGVIVTSHEPEELAKTMTELLNNDEQLKAFKANAGKASKVLRWEIEEQVLAEIYSDLL